jgi:outer membrane protein TolC
VENGLVFYAQEQVRNRALKTAADSSEKTLALANQLYTSGLSNFINVLDAERSLYQVRDAQAQSDRAVAENLIALYKALGGGWEVAGLNQAGGMPGKK